MRGRPAQGRNSTKRIQIIRAAGEILHRSTSARKVKNTRPTGVVPKGYGSVK